MEDFFFGQDELLNMGDMPMQNTNNNSAHIPIKQSHPQLSQTPSVGFKMPPSNFSVNFPTQNHDQPAFQSQQRHDSFQTNYSTSIPSRLDSISSNSSFSGSSINSHHMPSSSFATMPSPTVADLGMCLMQLESQANHHMNNIYDNRRHSFSGQVFQPPSFPFLSMSSFNNMGMLSQNSPNSPLALSIPMVESATPIFKSDRFDLSPDNTPTLNSLNDINPQFGRRNEGKYIETPSPTVTSSADSYSSSESLVIVMKAAANSSASGPVPVFTKTDGGSHNGAVPQEVRDQSAAKLKAKVSPVKDKTLLKLQPPTPVLTPLVNQLESASASMESPADSAEPSPSVVDTPRDDMEFERDSTADVLEGSQQQDASTMDEDELKKLEKKKRSERVRLRQQNRNLTCFNCKSTNTPLWRRTMDKKHPLCNACGLFFKQYGKHRVLKPKKKVYTDMILRNLFSLY
jgi:hypothetical protein